MTHLERLPANTFLNRVCFVLIKTLLFIYLLTLLYTLLSRLSAELSVCLCDSAQKVRNIFGDVESSGGRVKHIILLKSAAEELESLRNDAEKFGITIHTFDEVIELGQEGAQPDRLPNPDDLHLLCYTSGTTGKTHLLQPLFFTQPGVVTNVYALPLRSCQGCNDHPPYDRLSHYRLRHGPAGSCKSMFLLDF